MYHSSCITRCCSAAVRSKAEAIFNIKQSWKKLTQPLNRYVIWQMVLLLAALFVFILLEGQLASLVKISFAFTTLLTLINCGAIMEQKCWVFHVEFLRLLSPLIIPMYNFAVGGHAIVPLQIIYGLFVFIAWYRTLHRQYMVLVYRAV